MDKLKDFLLEQGYYRIKLHKTVTNHFEIKAKINSVKGKFILDTGASNSCVGFNEIETFNLNPEDSEHKASGAGSTEIDTQISKKNKIKIGEFSLKKTPLILIDLSHINNALIKQEAKPVQGIIGADILHKGKAIIDYDKKYLYLLPKKDKK
ncbi:MAG: retropepsin-like aspartic protease [Bacteroidota bacterium]